MNLVDIFSKTLSDYDKSSFDWVNSIVTNATMQVGLYIVGILLMLEIAKIYERVNSSNSGVVTLKMFQAIAWQAALAGIMVAAWPYLFQFLMLIGIGFVKLISQFAGSTLDLINPPSVDAPKNVLDGLAGLASLVVNPGNALSYGLAFAVAFVVQLVAYVMIWVIIILRFFQLYVLFALGPIPMSSFASEEHRQIGITYIKKTLAYIFQPAVIMIVMGVYSYLSKLTIDMGNAIGMLTGHDGLVALTKSIVFAIVFIIILWQTHRISSNQFGV